MKAIKLEFDYWEALKSHMLKTYPNKIVFMYDSQVSFFDAEEETLVDPQLYEFDSIEEFQDWAEEQDECNMVDHLCVLWVNGEIEQELIYDLRG